MDKVGVEQLFEQQSLPVGANNGSAASLLVPPAVHGVDVGLVMDVPTIDLLGVVLGVERGRHGGAERKTCSGGGGGASFTDTSTCGTYTLAVPASANLSPALFPREASGLPSGLGSPV